MIIKKLTGYMLSNVSDSLPSGQPWWPFNTNVYVCMNLETAKQIMFADGIWKTIYRVKAKNISCKKIDGNIIQTDESTKIIVVSPVLYSARSNRTEADLLRNAKHALPRFSKIMKQAYNQENVR